MPLPLLIIPLAVAGGSALAQTIAKLKTHSRLNELRSELEGLEAAHREEMQLHYDRQTELCRRLGMPGPELPQVLREPEEVVASEQPMPKWRRLLRRRKRTVADGSPHTRLGIIGRQWAGFTAGTVWRTSSATILNIVRPVAAKLLGFLPKLGAAGGAGGSIATSTGLRFALSAFSVVGIVVGPLLTGWAIAREVRKVQKARRELESTRLERELELTDWASRTMELQQQLEAATLPTGAALL